MRTVALLRDGEGLLPPRNRSDRRADLAAVQKEMHRLADIAGRDVGKTDRTGVGNGVVKGRSEREQHHGDGKIQRAAVAVNVRHIELDGGGADRQKRRKVDCHIALRYVGDGFDRAADRDLHGAVAGGNIVLEGGPIDGDREGISVRNRAGEKAGFVGKRQLGVVARRTAASTASGEGSDHHIAVGGQVEKTVLHVCVIDFALRQKAQPRQLPAHIRHGAGCLGGFVLRVDRAFQRLPCDGVGCDRQQGKLFALCLDRFQNL